MLNWKDALSDEQLQRYKKLRIMDVVEFACEVLLPKLKIQPLAGKVGFHPVCSLQKMGLVEAAVRVINACSEGAYIPPSTGCCGMAGDRGFLYPELTASATKRQAQEVAAAGCACHVSSSLTCELAMSNAVGSPYVGVLHLLEEVTRS